MKMGIILAQEGGREHERSALLVRASLKETRWPSLSRITAVPDLVALDSKMLVTQTASPQGSRHDPCLGHRRTEGLSLDDESLSFGGGTRST